MPFFCHNCQKRVSVTEYICDECHQDFIEELEDDQPEEQQQAPQPPVQQQQQQQQQFPFPFAPFFQNFQQANFQQPPPMGPFGAFPFFPPPPMQQQQQQYQYQQHPFQAPFPFPFQQMFGMQNNSVGMAQVPDGVPVFRAGMPFPQPQAAPIPFPDILNNLFNMINNVEGVEGSNEGAPARPQIIGDYAFGNIESIIDRLFDQAGHRGPPPTSNTVIESLENFEYPEEKIECSTDCAVCKDEFCTKDKCIRLPCQHLFHDTCILPWLKQRNSCPVCRYALPSEEEINRPNGT